VKVVVVEVGVFDEDGEEAGGSTNTVVVMVAPSLAMGSTEVVLSVVVFANGAMEIVTVLCGTEVSVAASEEASMSACVAEEGDEESTSGFAW
jgi:hypothetical protein